MNLIKISRKPYLAFFTAIAILFVSCSEYQSKEVIEELNKSKIINDLKNDEELKFIQIKNKEFSKLLMTNLKNKSLSFFENKLHQFDEIEILKDLGMLDLYLNHLEKAEKHIKNIKNKHSHLSQLSDDDMHLILESFNEDSTSILKKISMNNCDSEFEKSFHKIHAEYDANITWCTIISLMSLNAAAPCYGWAAGKAIVGVVVTIEEYALCTK